MFKNETDRKRFMYCLGEYYAALGGLYGAYRESNEAFDNAKGHHLYRFVEIADTDYWNFSVGFDTFQKLRITMLLEKVRAEGEMKDLLTNVNLTGIQVSSAKNIRELIAQQEQAKIKQEG